MKIAVFEPSFLTPRPNAASYLGLLQNQVNMLSKLGHEVTVLIEDNGIVQPEPKHNFAIYPLKGILTKMSTRFSMTNSAISYFSGSFSPDVIPEAIKALSNNLRPDILYSCGTSFSSLFPALLSHKTGIPSVHYVFEFNGEWSWWRGDIDVMHGYKVSTSYLVRQFISTFPRELIKRNFLHKWALRKITRIVACSCYTKKILNDFVPDLGDVPIIYPGIDIPPLSERKSAKENAPIITYLGHLWQGRGVLDLLKAFSQVVRRHPDAKLVVASSNVHSLTEYYFEKIIDEQKLRRNVLRMGIVKNSQLELLAPSSVIVLPYRDTPSVKLLESMAAGKPVISTKVGWNSELISDGVSGFLTNIGDVQKISQRLDLLLTRPELGEMMGKRARSVIEEKCSIDRNTQNLCDVLRSALCESSN